MGSDLSWGVTPWEGRRLQSELKKARALLEELVAGPPEREWPLWYSQYTCVLCGADADAGYDEEPPFAWRVTCEHKPDCQVTRARALLGKDTP